MERFNLTIRMTLHRFTRLTNGHSKKTRNHDAMLGLYFAWYNWCRKHSSLKTRPAVKAGVASEIWSLERLLTEVAKSELAVVRKPRRAGQGNLHLHSNAMARK